MIKVYDNFLDKEKFDFIKKEILESKMYEKSWITEKQLWWI